MAAQGDPAGQWLQGAARRDRIFAEQVAAAQAAPRERRGRSRTGTPSRLSFKGVVLEGLEVVFIALTFGATSTTSPLASLAAGAAVLVVAGGRGGRAPLARVPENSMKFVVGIMLTAFGTFWGAEGAGAHWPGSDAALPVVVGAVAVFAVALVAALRRGRTSTQAVVEIVASH